MFLAIIRFDFIAICFNSVHRPWYRTGTAKILDLNASK
jgi:hypothetical protein